MKNNKFFTFLQPMLDYIDNGNFFRKPFCWLYTALAVLNLLIPFALLFVAIDKGIFRYANGKMIFAFILIWLIITFVAWIGFQIWWNRREKVYNSASTDDDFVAIPVFSHFVQTLGEWLGTFIGVGGALLSLTICLLLGGDNSLAQFIGLGFITGTGLLMVVLFPIYGFLIVVIARVLAELYRALASIANNTKKS